MHTTSTSGDLSEKQKKHLDVLLKEYEGVVNGIRSIQETQRRMITLLPAALAVGIPLLIRPANDIPADLKPYLFAGFSFMFLLLVTNYVGLTRGILRLSIYQMQHITPQVDEILESHSIRLMGWEYFVRERVRQNPSELLGFSLIHGAEFLLLASPSLLCFLLGLYFANHVLPTPILWIVSVLYISLVSLTCYFAWKTVTESRPVPKADYIIRAGNEV